MDIISNTAIGITGLFSPSKNIVAIIKNKEAIVQTKEYIRHTSFVNTRGFLNFLRRMLMILKTATMAIIIVAILAGIKVDISSIKRAISINSEAFQRLPFFNHLQ